MIATYAHDAITIVAPGTAAAWGEPGTPTSTTVRGRFEFRTRLVNNPAGEMVTAKALVRIPNQTIGYGHKIQFRSVTYIILSIAEVKDFSTIRWLEMWVQ